MSLLVDALVLATAATHVVLTPYTKVEESFNLHATHDVLVYGLNSSSLPNFDHFSFPGAVPRTFLGSILLAWSSRPIIRLLNPYISSKADLQIIIRLVLATINALGLCILRRAVSRRFGFSTGVFFALLSCTQFHLPFWMGRTLPNMFAFFPVTLAYALLLFRPPNSTRPTQANVLRAIALLTFTAIVFRAELLLLLAPLVLQALLARWVSFVEVVRTGVGVGIGSILLTTILDTYLWRSPHPLWAEAHSIYFNVYQSKASEWGVSPPQTYFTSHLPKLLLSSFPLAILGSVVEPRRVGGLVVSALAFVGAMSGLGHKEWRFVVYAVPVFNVAAARGAYWLTRQRTRTILGRLSVLVVLGCIAANVLVTAVMTQVSMANYPGGVALARFNAMFNASENVHVHISNLAAQTGASLFLQERSPPLLSSFLSSSLPHPPPYSPSPPQHNKNWTYNKTENLTPQSITSSKHFTHAIVEFDQLPAFLVPEPEPGSGSGEWVNQGCVRAFDGFRFLRAGSGDGESNESNEKQGRSATGIGIGIWGRVPKLSVRYANKLCIVSRR